ncbi:MAG: tetratricopeptide repeat protein [Pseudomonadota bacterium]
MGDKAHNVIRFGEAELDLAARELRWQGELQAIEPRVFELLAFLIQERHRAVTKDEIQSEVWKGAIVSETALTRAVMKARRAVGDSADRQAVIRTVHGHGYQFIASQRSDTTETQSAPTTVLARPGKKVLPWIGVMALMLALAMVLWASLRSPATDGLRLAVLPIIDETGDSELQWVSLGLMGLGNQLLDAHGDIAKVSTDEVLRQVADSDIGAIDPDELFASLSKTTKASHVMLTRLEDTAGSFRLTYRVFSDSETLVEGTMVDAEPVALMRGAIAHMLRELGGDVAETRVISDDPFINEAFSRALSLSLEGRCQEALPMFEVVLASDPGNAGAAYEWAVCARISGMWQEARDRFDAVARDAERNEDPALLAKALNGLATVQLRTGEQSAVRPTLSRGLAAALITDDRELVGKLHVSLGIDAYKARDFETARADLSRARLAFTESDRGFVSGEVDAALANVNMAEGRLDEADTNLGTALQAFRDVGDRRNEAKMLNNYGYLRRLQGRSNEAEAYHLESLAIRKDIGDRVGQGRILGMLSVLYGESGAHDKAITASREAIDIATAANDKLYIATGYAQLARAYSLAGDSAAAITAFTESGEVFGAIGDYSREAQVRMRLARLAWQSGETTIAAEEIRRVKSDATARSMPQPLIEAFELEGDIAESERRTDAALVAYREAIAQVDASGFVTGQVRLLSKLASVALDNDDEAAAESAIGRLLAVAPNDANVWRMQARLSELRGDIDAAVSYMQKVRDDAPTRWNDNDVRALDRYLNWKVAGEP